MNKKLKILITGPVPPPAGGISIHIQRLVHLLESEFDIDLIDESDQKKDSVFNMRSLNILSYLKKVSHSNLLLVHSGNKLFKKIHILTGRLFRKKVIITLHGYGPKRKQPFRAIDNFFFGLSHKIILVNADIANRLSLSPKKCIVKHAFLPPVMMSEPALPTLVNDWLAKATSNQKVIICANASRLDMHNNQDLYGLDMSIEITNRLVKKGLPVNVVFTVSSIENCTALFSSYQQQINELKLNDHFLLINERMSFVKLIERSDIVIRPSNTDGDALTVREAIYLGKDVLASDVVKRPDGTSLFKTRDMDDMEIKLEMLVKKAKVEKLQPQGKLQAGYEDYGSFYIELIKNVALK